MRRAADSFAAASEAERGELQQTGEKLEGMVADLERTLEADRADARRRIEQLEQSKDELEKGVQRTTGELSVCKDKVDEILTL